MLKTTMGKLTIAAAMLGMTTIGAHAEVVDFNGVAGTNMPGSYKEYSWPGLETYFKPGVTSYVGGYSFSTAGVHEYLTPAWADIYSGGMDGRVTNNNTDFLHSTAALTVARVGGGSFNLNSLDLSNYYDSENIAAQASFTITGKLATGGTISTVVTLDNMPNMLTFHTDAAFNHFSLTGFTNITSFEIRGEPQHTVFAQSDQNIAIDNINISAVPEPSSWMMMGLGLAGLLLRRKQRSA